MSTMFRAPWVQNKAAFMLFVEAQLAMAELQAELPDQHDASGKRIVDNSVARVSGRCRCAIIEAAMAWLRSELLENTPPQKILVAWCIAIAPEMASLAEEFMDAEQLAAFPGLGGRHFANALQDAITA